MRKTHKYIGSMVTCIDSVLKPQCERQKPFLKSSRMACQSPDVEASGNLTIH